MAGLRWGIMGSGGIAQTMTEALQQAGSSVTTVGSARPGAAASFAAAWGIPHAVDSYQAVSDAANVDIIYVATTNDRHHQNMLDGANAGKAVLCEKPLAMNARQGREMLAVADRAGTFAMEALWMRFLPFVAKLDEVIAAGAIGTVTHVAANFSFPAPQDADRRWMNRSLGGGALLDLGIYPISLVHHLLGTPEGFEAKARLSATGVDESTTVISHHRGGATATMMCSFTADTTSEAVISGPEGRVRLHAPFHNSRRLTLERRGEVVDTYDTDFAGHGFQFEIAETERCVAAGLTESPLRPHAVTIEVLDWLDAIRARCNIDYEADHR